MRQIFGATLSLFAVAVGISFGADNSLGTWKLNIEKSRAATKAAGMESPATRDGWATLKSITLTREAADSGVKVTNHLERTDGTTRHVTYTAKYDGTEAAVAGGDNPFSRIAVKQIDANTFTDERRTNDASRKSTGRIVISDNGKTLTMTLKGTTLQGTPYTTVDVYEKQ
jgi:hypothetical protein